MLANLTLELPLIIRGLNKLVATSEVISHFGSTAVLGLTLEIVMKVGNDIDINHLHTLDYIKHHAPRVPIPDIHGILQKPNSKRISFIMSRAPGEPLESKWKFMGEDEKASIREQSDTMIGEIQFLPAPVSDETGAVLGGGNPRADAKIRDAKCVLLRSASATNTSLTNFSLLTTAGPGKVTLK